MTSVTFKERTHSLAPHPNDVGRVGSLDIVETVAGVHSMWKPSEYELQALIDGGYVMATVCTQGPPPPIGIETVPSDNITEMTHYKAANDFVMCVPEIITQSSGGIHLPNGQVQQRAHVISVGPKTRNVINDAWIYIPNNIGTDFLLGGDQVVFIRECDVLLIEVD